MVKKNFMVRHICCHYGLVTHRFSTKNHKLRKFKKENKSTNLDNTENEHSVDHLRQKYSLSLLHSVCKIKLKFALSCVIFVCNLGSWNVYCHFRRPHMTKTLIPLIQSSFFGNNSQNIFFLLIGESKQITVSCSSGSKLFF